MPVLHTVCFYTDYCPFQINFYFFRKNEINTMYLPQPKTTAINNLKFPKSHHPTIIEKLYFVLELAALQQGNKMQ